MNISPNQRERDVPAQTLRGAVTRRWVFKKRNNSPNIRRGIGRSKNKNDNNPRNR